MIIIRLWGGIGNQLFQYSFGEYLRLKTRQDVKYDIASFGRSDKLRELEIKILNSDITTVSDIRFSHHRGLFNRFFRCCFCLKPNHHFIMETDFSEDMLSLLPTNSVLYLQGYWQKAIYPNELLKTNPHFFVPHEKIPLEIQNIEKAIAAEKQTVALHVRRGDYFSSLKNRKRYGVCNPDYYRNALHFLEQKQGNYKIMVFSDDLKWVKNNIQLSDDAFFVPNYPVNPFWFIYLMSCCRHNIISNSSFSWWGAYLNIHKNKTIIAPTEWMIGSNIMPVLSEWIRL
jgi:hypothetical protein